MECTQPIGSTSASRREREYRYRFAARLPDGGAGGDGELVVVDGEGDHVNSRAPFQLLLLLHTVSWFHRDRQGCENRDDVAARHKVDESDGINEARDRHQG